MIAKSIFINFIITISLSIQAFMLNQAFGVNLGADQLGLMKLFSQLVAYLSLAELGLGTASAFSLYKPLLDKDYYKVSVIMSTISVLYRYVSAGIIAIGLLILFFLPAFTDDKMQGGMVYFYWLAYVFSISFNYTFSKYQILFTANQEFDVVRLTQGCSKFIMQGLQLFVIVKYQSFIYFTALLFVDSIIQYCIFKYRYIRNYKHIFNVSERDYTIKKDILNLLWHKIGTLVVFNTDYLIISYFLGLKMVGIYASYMMVFQMVKVLFSIVSNVLSPKIGLLIAKNSREKSYETWKHLNAIFLVASIVAVICVYSLINPFVLLWMGEDFILPNSIVILLIFNLYFDLTRNIIGMFKFNSGFFDDIHIPLVESAINIVLSVILVNLIGIAGVIIGTLVSNVIVIYLWGPILVFKRCFGKPATDYIFYLIPKISMLAIVVVIYYIYSSAYHIGINGWVGWMTSAFITATVSLFITVMVFMIDKDFRVPIFNRFQNIL